MNHAGAAAQCNALGLSQQVGTSKDTAFHQAAMLEQEARALCVRLETLADRLVGYSGGGQSVAEKSPATPRGVFGNLQDASQQARQRIREAHQALEAIEGGVP